MREAPSLPTRDTLVLFTLPKLRSGHVRRTRLDEPFPKRTYLGRWGSTNKYDTGYTSSKHKGQLYTNMNIRGKLYRK
jgi:hypothetical protein